jgi:hypothetical protein
MYKFLAKNGQILAFGAGAVVSALFFISWLSGYQGYLALPDEQKSTTGIFDAGLIGSVVLFIIAIALLVYFGIVQTASSFKQSAPGLMGIGALLLIFLIAWATSGGEPVGIVKEAAEKMGTSSSTIRLIDAGLLTMIVMSIVTAVAFIGSEIRNFFK